MYLGFRTCSTELKFKAKLVCKKIQQSYYVVIIMIMYVFALVRTLLNCPPCIDSSVE